MDSPQLSYGLQRLDHAVGNVHDLQATLDYLQEATGFHQFAEFTTEVRPACLCLPASCPVLSLGFAVAVRSETGSHVTAERAKLIGGGLGAKDCGQNPGTKSPRCRNQSLMQLTDRDLTFQCSLRAHGMTRMGFLVTRRTQVLTGLEILAVISRVTLSGRGDFGLWP